MNKLPLYRIVVNPNDESGVYSVSLVDEPAIEVDWIKLSKMIEVKFSANKDKQLLYGPLLIPDKMIYRRDDNGTEYNIVFDKETIELIADKYNKNKFNDVFNFQHSDKMVEAYLKENWIVGQIDKSQNYGFELPEGTWFGAVKVEDQNFWNDYVSNGEVKGFSVELKCDVELVELSAHNKINININLMEIKTQDGVVLYYDGNEFAVDTLVYTDAAFTQLVTEGDYVLEDGTTFKVSAEGKVTELQMGIPEEPAGQEDMTTEEEVVVEPTTEKLTNEEVLTIVQPLFDEFKNAYAELEAKVAELEAKLTEAKKVEEELSTKVETLSKTAGANTITKKDDRSEKQLKNDEFILSRVRAFSKR
jgi:hypothetical protein